MRRSYLTAIVLLAVAAFAIVVRGAATHVYAAPGTPNGSVAEGTDTWQALQYPDPAPGFSKTYCYGLNDNGDAVGWYLTPSNRAYLWSRGTYVGLHALMPSGATSSLASGINNPGVIVGDYYVGTQEHGYVMQDGVVTPFDFAGKAMTHPRGINSRGDIAGYSMTLNTSTSWQAFIMTNDGTVIDVAYPSAVYTSLLGINDHGDAVGEYKDAAGAVHGLLRTSDGNMTSLDAPGASSSGGSNGTSAWKVNSRGEIIGYYWDTQVPSISHGFVWRRGEFRTDDYPTAVHTMNHGLNNHGDICGMMSFTSSGAIQWGGFIHNVNGAN